MVHWEVVHRGVVHRGVVHRIIILKVISGTGRRLKYSVAWSRKTHKPTKIATEQIDLSF